MQRHLEAEAPSAPRIEIDAVSKSFDGGRTMTLDAVSLTIAGGSFVALVGASGAGKTTLLKTINRLVDPDHGEVRIDGVPIAAGEVADLRRRIGYVFQGIGLFPHLSVAENIAITPRLLGWPAADIDARAREMLELVDLPRSFADRLPAMLSGGQRQRVGVARALAARPGIVLMDEPFGALDPLTRVALAETYRDLHRRLGLTTVMVTHDIQEAVLLADRIVVIAAGRIAADGTPRELMSGHPDPDVARMMASPRRQAEQVRAIVEGRDDEGTVDEVRAVNGRAINGLAVEQGPGAPRSATAGTGSAP